MDTNATVTAEALALYSQMSASSAPMFVFHKGDNVAVDLEVNSAGNAWCSVRTGQTSGYVRCAGLERRPQTASAPAGGQAVVVSNSLTGPAKQSQRRLKSEKAVFLIALSEFPDNLIEELGDYYSKRYGLIIQVLPGVELDPSVIDENRGQVVADRAILVMKRHYPELVGDSSATVIGLTRLDMISPGFKHYAWNVARGNFDVISTCRMDPVNYGEAPNEVLLKARLRKMVTRSIGTLHYRLPFNQNPKSVLYANMPHLEELDAADEDF